MRLFAGVRRFLERGPMSEIEFRDQTAVVGVGYSRSPEVPGGFSRRSGVSVLTLAVRAALDACNDAGIDPSDLDGGACWGFNDTVAPQQLLHSLQAKEGQLQLSDAGRRRASPISRLSKPPRPSTTGYASTPSCSGP